MRFAMPLGPQLVAHPEAAPVEKPGEERSCERSYPHIAAGNGNR
jgi:hypothetical protein